MQAPANAAGDGDDGCSADTISWRPVAPAHADKYGYKQIKRIGLISYTNERPDDYWTKLGYDWYAGL